MNQAWVTFLRSIGVLIATAILTYISVATNLNGVIGPYWSVLIAGVASSILAVLDDKVSPSGTVLFGRVGKRR